MLRHPPRYTYSGLTIVMSNPSRHDSKLNQLLSGDGGVYFENKCLAKIGIRREHCDIRLAEDKSPWLPETKCVLLLGDKAMKDYLPNGRGNEASLNELRGSSFLVDGICYMASYLPQDCVDRQNFESRLNPHLYEALEKEFREESEKSGVAAKKRKGLTLRSNYAFWLFSDLLKLGRILDNPLLLANQDDPTYHYYPSSSNVISLLLTTKSKFLYFDMETNEELKITVFSFSFGLSDIYIIPVVLHDYSLAYSLDILANIFRALSVAIRDNCLVAHNGSGFDFFVLADRYGIPLGEQCYDTMLAQARIYPEVEKSLGHCTSLYTYEVYHKDEANFAFGNHKQHLELCMYCGKDVSTMVRIHLAQQQVAQSVVGLSASIAQVMASIRPYLITTLTGIAYRQEKVVEIMCENDRLMTQYLRLLEYLIGPEAWLELKKKSKKPLPTSNGQCVHYFHEQLGYPVVNRSKKTKKPSLSEKNMLRLRLKHENPTIDLCLAFRKLSKETGTLKFTPFKL